MSWRLAWWLLAVAGAGLAWAQGVPEASAPGLTVPVGGAGLIPVGDLTLPGALVAIAFLLRGVKPTIRVEHAGEVVVRREDVEPRTGPQRKRE